jgi:uncharacterized membrane protein
MAPVSKITNEDDVALLEPDSAIETIEPRLEKIVAQKVQVALRMESFRGPMPPPEHLGRYDKIVPGCARTIVDEFQANSRHNRTMEVTGLTGMVRRDTRAQWMAFVLVLVGFGLVWELAASEHEKTAIAVATMLLGSIVVGFLTGVAPWKKSAKDRDAKIDENDD